MSETEVKVSKDDILRNIEDRFCIVDMTFNGTEVFPQPFEAFNIAGTVADFFNENMDFENHVFEKCVFKEMDFRRWNLKAASFYTCLFDNCLFPDELEQLCFDNCEFENIELTDSKIVDLTIFGSKYRKVSFVVQKIKNVFQMCSFSDINFSNAKIPRIHLLDCVAFTNVDFSNAELESAVLSGISAGGDTCVKFDNAVLTTTNFEKSHFFAEAFKNTVLDRTVFSGSDFNKIEFKGQNLSNVWFDGCDIKDCVFEECNMYGAKINGAKLSTVKFINVDASAIFAQKAVLKACDFYHSNLDYSNFAYAELLGCNFDQCSMSLMYRHDFKSDKTYFESCVEKNIVEMDQDLYDAEHFY